MQVNHLLIVCYVSEVHLHAFCLDNFIYLNCNQGRINRGHGPGPKTDIEPYSGPQRGSTFPNNIWIMDIILLLFGPGSKIILIQANGDTTFLIIVFMIPCI